MNRTLLLLRHAQAAAPPAAHASDQSRPLTAKGRRHAEALGASLRERYISPDYVILSSAVRTHQTCHAVFGTSLQDASVVKEDKLYLAPVGAILEYLQGVPENIRTLLLIGHNPGLSDLCLYLYPKKVASAALVSLPTCGLDIYTCRTTWRDLTPESITAFNFLYP